MKKPFFAGKYNQNFYSGNNSQVFYILEDATKDGHEPKVNFSVSTNGGSFVSMPQIQYFTGFPAKIMLDMKDEIERLKNEKEQLPDKMGNIRELLKLIVDNPAPIDYHNPNGPDTYVCCGNAVHNGHENDCRYNKIATLAKYISDQLPENKGE